MIVTDYQPVGWAAYYPAKSRRPEGCRIARIDWTADHAATIWTGDCGYTAVVRLGEDRYLAEALDGWPDHMCRDRP